MRGQDAHGIHLKWNSTIMPALLGRWENKTANEGASFRIIEITQPIKKQRQFCQSIKIAHYIVKINNWRKLHLFRWWLEENAAVNDSSSNTRLLINARDVGPLVIVGPLGAKFRSKPYDVAIHKYNYTLMMYGKN